MLLKYNTTKNIMKFIVFLALSIVLVSCSTDKKPGEEEIVKKKPVNPNIFERVKESDSGGIIFGGKEKKGTTYDFATSNVLWRATLQSLNFVPLINASYSGGVIVTDWYGSDSEESIKIQVKFLSDEITISSLEVNSFKKNCQKDNFNSCKVTALDSDFNSKIKDTIMQNVRKISREESKKK